MNAEQTARRWLDQLQKPDSEAFAQLFTLNGRYIDPAFGLARQGRDFFRLRHKKWHAAVADFGANVERMLVDGQTAVIQSRQPEH